LLRCLLRITELSLKKMLKNEFDGVTEEDMEYFQELLVKFYEKPWEEAYTQLTEEIEERLRRKDTNKNYRSRLTADLDDLIISVVARLIKVNGKLRRAGKEILNFYAMLENRIHHVYHEELRRLSVSARMLDVDEMDVASQTASIDREMEEREAWALEVNCYKRCLDELPEHVLNIFLEYYDMDGVPPAARADARRKIALRVAGISAEDATREEVANAKGNLDSMLSKWRRNTLTPCKDKCLKGKR